MSFPKALTDVIVSIVVNGIYFHIPSFSEGSRTAFSFGFRWLPTKRSLSLRQHYPVNENCLGDIFYSDTIVWVMT